MLNRVPACGGWRFRLWWWAKRRQSRFIRRYLRDWERIAGETQNALASAQGSNHDYCKALDRQQAHIARLEAALAAALATPQEVLDDAFIDRETEWANKWMRVVEENRRLTAALTDLRINANRLCDRQLGGTYEEDCRRSLVKAAAALAPQPEKAE